MKDSQHSKYKVIWKKKAEESLKEIGNWITAEKIRSKVEKHLSKDPYSGKPLTGNWKGFYRYRFSDYRVIHEIKRTRIK